MASIHLGYVPVTKNLGMAVVLPGFAGKLQHK
jgi:hypothetical protein